MNIRPDAITLINARWHESGARRIAERIVIEADLVLVTPAHFGSGDAPDSTALPLLYDPHDDVTPLLPGASLAGALRAHLTSRERGYLSDEVDDGMPAALFGSLHRDTYDPQRSLWQSRVILDDALGYWQYPDTAVSDIRRGVRLDSDSRTAKDKLLYGHEVWNAGLVFPLRCELLIFDQEDPEPIIAALVAALSGLSDGSIRLGARKHRGFGQLRIDRWWVQRYRMRSPDDLMAWLRLGANSIRPLKTVSHGSDLLALIGQLPIELIDDARLHASLNAVFGIDGSMLIRQYEGTDTVHLTTQNGATELRVVSGTSIGGALRAQMRRILTVFMSPIEADDRIASLFGTAVENMDESAINASRVRIDETAITGALPDWVQTRVSIDRFTGGALDSALFTEQPVFGTNDVRVSVNLQIINPTNDEIGLLLLALKDLWLGELSVGGERSIGRGRLSGQYAVLTTLHGSWTFEAVGTDELPSLRINGDTEMLQGYVNTLTGEAQS